MTYRGQRGAAALVVAMVLLFGMTIVAFFANRGMIFEQRTSANQVRATRAFELADAGLQWAIARLNDPRALEGPPSTSCAPATGTVSFYSRYIRPAAADPTHPLGWLNPLTTAYPGCRVDANGGLDCDCPTAGAADLSANTSAPRFRVKFNQVTTPTVDTLAVEIISRGCTNGDPCDPSATTTSGDATAVARVIVKILPTVSGGPGAGLISGSTTVVSGSINVVNTDTQSNGITINTGSTVNLGSGSGNSITVQSLPGTPARASILDNDPSLLALTNSDASGDNFFSSFFGEGIQDFKTKDPLVKYIDIGTTSPQNNTCSDDVSCGRVVSDFYDKGFRKFWVQPSVTFNSGNMPSTGTPKTMGTVSDPIALATGTNLTLTGGIDIYGMLYCATATAVDDLTLSGGGNATVYGAMISRGDIARTGNGNLSIVYQAPMFNGTAPPKGIMVPVPGSWRDKASAF